MGFNFAFQLVENWRSPQHLEHQQTLEFDSVRTRIERRQGLASELFGQATLLGYHDELVDACAGRQICHRDKACQRQTAVAIVMHPTDIVPCRRNAPLELSSGLYLAACF